MTGTNDTSTWAGVLDLRYTDSSWIGETNDNISLNATIGLTASGLAFNTRVIIAVVCAVVIITGVAGNICVLVVAIKSRMSPLYMCLASLSVSDILLLVSVPIIPVPNLLGVSSGYVGYGFCFVLTVLNRGTLICSVTTVTFICVERFMAIQYPLHAKVLLSRKRIMIVLICIWLVSFSASAPYVAMTDYYMEKEEFVNGVLVVTSHPRCILAAYADWEIIYETVIITVFILLPVLVMLILYGIMIRTLTSGNTLNTVDNDTSQKNSDRYQAVVMMACVAAMFSICIVPFQIFVLFYDHAYQLLEKISDSAWTAIVWSARILVYTNSAANPIIYSVISKNFRSQLKLTFACKKQSQSAAGTSGTVDRTKL